MTDNSMIAFRKANVDDIDVLVEARVWFLNAFYDHPEDDESEALKKYIKSYFLGAMSDNEFIAYLAEEDDIIIGTAGMVVWHIPPKYGLETGKQGYILFMYTVPTHRGRGISSALLDELMKEAKDLNIKYLHLHTSKDGHGIYTKAGFEPVDRQELFLKI